MHQRQDNRGAANITAEVEARTRISLVQEFLSSSCSDEVRLRLVEESDADFILSLRLDPDLNLWISPTRTGLDEQRRWIVDYRVRELAGQEFYFIVERDRMPIGTARVYDIRHDSFRWGSWIIKRGEASAALRSAAAVYSMTFGWFGFPLGRFEVRKEHPSNRFHRRFGAVCVREDETHFYYELTSQAACDYLSARHLWHAGRNAA